MASLLRSSRYFFNVANCVRAFSISAERLPHRLCGLSKHNTSLKAFANARWMASTASAASTKPVAVSDSEVQSRLHAMDRSLYRIDTEVRRSGRISRKDVDELLSEVEQLGAVTPSQGLLLIRSCGSFLREESAAERNKLADTVWEVLQKFGCQKDVSHYNALLQVYLENERRFSPTEFLSNMEQVAGIQPNRVTYQRLIHAYCQEGDIAGASKILEYMKDKELPINEKVFNSLITGHARANDMENAKNILDVMRNAQLEPTAETYCALMEGYAKQGNVEAIKQVLQETEQQGVGLLDHHYLSLVQALACAGHQEHVPVVLNKVRRLSGYTQDCINACLELLAQGQDEVAYKVFLTLTPSQNRQHGNFFLVQLVRCNLPSEKILYYCKELQEHNPRALLKSTEASLQQGKTELAMSLLKELRNQGIPLRPHYFNPLIVRKKSNEAEVYNVMKEMIALGVTPNYDILLEFVFPILNTDDPTAVVDKHKELGMTVGSVVNPLLHFYLSNADPVRALKLVESHPVNLVAPLIVPSLVYCFKETRDARTMARILNVVEESPEATTASKRVDWGGRFLMDCSSGPDGISVLSQLIPELAANSIQVSASTAETIRSKHGNKLSSSVLDMLDKISSEVLADEVVSSFTPIPSQNEMTIEDLEAHLVELKSKGMNTRGALRRLLLLHCRYRNLDRALELAEQLARDGGGFTGVMHAQLMDLYVSHGDLDKALEHYKLMGQVEESFRLDDHKVLNLATLMISSGKWQDAKTLLEDHFEKHGVKEAPDTLQRNVFRLLNAAASQHQQWPEGAEVTRTFFDLVVLKCGYSPTSALVLGPLVRVHLLRDDLPSALATFESCVKQYKHTPLKKELSKQLIEKADHEGLQKVVDLSIEAHGEMNTLYDLATYFLECGQVRQAQKILETPGLRAKHQRLDLICEGFLTRDMVTELEHLVHITKDLFDIDRDAMYFYLLKAYAKTGDADKALEVWTKMQEENVQPSARTLRFLGNLLQQHGHTTLPFIMPEEEEAVQVPVPTGRRSRTPFTSRLAVNVDKALEEKQKFEERGESLSVGDVSHLIDTLVKNDRIKEAARLMEEMLQGGQNPYRSVLSLLLRRLSSLGDVETLSTLTPLLSVQLCRQHSVSNLLCNAYTNSGRAGDLLTQIEENMGYWKERFPVGGVLGMLRDQPEMEDRVHSLAEKYATQEECLEPMNTMWMHKMICGRFEEADKILKDYPKMEERLMYASVLKYSRSADNEAVARHLAQSVGRSQAASPSSKALVYGNLVEFLVSKGRAEEALQTFEKAQAECGLQVDNWKLSTLTQLQTGLRASGKVLPFLLPKRTVTQKANEAEEDSLDEERQR
ncbi:leucine-rich PPR motif-containing protein, mitochondrial-like [Ornithodoros turicata]|uniref:leucine-rich PPR motif-containing protein, mitochondrial-like n=1 Tax=Ornithodoros turicata TaxID=34597 RepID=UPI0031399A1D